MNVDINNTHIQKWRKLNTYFLAFQGLKKTFYTGHETMIYIFIYKTVEKNL
jgi:hypothetical protein